ncbi:hypothetical protein ASD50_12670 [Mesorhizobium sp. Root552]|uniref:hypothetical protein n=1 Tax=Mesorhizobium sp. Root552 TaxID=1736555 RepID=UPI0006FE961B|nr:hypothetical protein [Mesorhizobium sp. Root552]KQZ12262.1 hypothetical protein ASD50_12670 [Mesorhizobium sp. Root552]
MDRETRNAAIAALLIIGVFSLFTYYLPAIMLAAGSRSSLLAVAVIVVFLLALFVLFWLRGRSQSRRSK